MSRLGALAAVMFSTAILFAWDGQPESTGASATYDYSGVEASIQEQVDGGNFPGASLLLFKDGAPIYEHYFGTFTPETNVLVASSTKWISGAVIMSLVDSGAISLDDTVADYLPDWTGEKGTITIRQLFSHTSGLDADNACLGDLTMSLGQCVDLIRDVGLVSSPGSQFYYGGSSMQVAGRIAEVATGQAWNQIYNERIKNPLGASMFYWPPANPQIGGGVVSTLGDYSKLMQMLLDDGEYNGQQVLSPEAIMAMEADQTAGAPIVYSPHPDPRRYGVGVWRDIVSGTGQAVQVSSQGRFGMSPWLDRERRYFGIFFVQDQLSDVYLLVAQTQAAIRDILDADADPDGDGIVDGDDNCPLWSNATQTMPAWTVPAGDSDCDGYPDTAQVGVLASESVIGTVASQHCAATPTISDEPPPDAWPPDFNDNQLVNISDILAYNPVFGKHPADPGWSPRFDLNANGVINVGDVLQLNQFIFKRCD